MARSSIPTRGSSLLCSCTGCHRRAASTVMWRFTDGRRSERFYCVEHADAIAGRIATSLPAGVEAVVLSSRPGRVHPTPPSTSYTSCAEEQCTDAATAILRVSWTGGWTTSTPYCRGHLDAHRARMEGPGRLIVEAEVVDL